jgi:hypothetical protein
MPKELNPEHSTIYIGFNFVMIVLYIICIYNGSTLINDYINPTKDINDKTRKYRFGIGIAQIFIALLIFIHMLSLYFIIYNKDIKSFIVVSSYRYGFIAVAINLILCFLSLGNIK